MAALPQASRRFSFA